VKHTSGAEAVLAFDTSNYTTSAASFDGSRGNNVSLLLPVGKGELGLRQSEALFLHLKQLPLVIAGLKPNYTNVKAIGVSSKPREAEDSYMPCFLAGVSQAKSIAALTGLPYFEFSHQQGHIAAAAWSSGHTELLDTPHFAWHLSGGTTELLLVSPDGCSISCRKIGGTKDISAGQLIDRTGQLLGLSFPSGKELDLLAQQAERRSSFRVREKGCCFSLSGMENKASGLFKNGASKEDTAYFVLTTLAEVIIRATEEAMAEYGALPVLYSGGVASSTILRDRLEGCFAKPEHSADNALGISILTYRMLNTL
jgi:N6-L-threonylcarbamoyladenine synthase